MSRNKRKNNGGQGAAQKAMQQSFGILNVGFLRSKADAVLNMGLASKFKEAPTQKQQGNCKII
jgi:hypothetical protein